MPVLCSYFLRAKISEKDNFAIRFLKGLYEPVLRRVTIPLAFVGGAVALLQWPYSFSDGLVRSSSSARRRLFATHMIRTTSIGPRRLHRHAGARRAGAQERIPGVAYTFSRIGTAEVATDPMGVNVADTYIFYKPLEEWPKIDGKVVTKDDLPNA